MPIINNSTKKTIANEAKLCKSLFSKARGLMFSKPYPLIMEFNKESIILLHMLFVFWPIDILFLNKNKKVVGLVKNAKPFQLQIKSKKPAMYVVELPAGTVKKTKTKINHNISF